MKGYEPKDLNSLKKLERKGFEGVDVTLEIALFEYGMVWKELEEGSGEWFFVHVVPNEEYIHGRNQGFRGTSLTETDLEIDVETLVSIISYIGSTREKWEEEEFPRKVFAAVSYGEDVFSTCGSASTETFEVKK